MINGEDLLSQMGWEVLFEEKDEQNLELDSLQIKILDIIAIEEKSFDEIINEVKCDVADLMVALTKLEIKSLIKHVDNKYYKN